MAYVGDPFTLTYHIHNPTFALAEINIQVDVTDAFVFSGYKHASFRVLPLTNHQLYYNCYPIAAGLVRLPKLKVLVKKEGVEKDVPIEEAGSDSVGYDGDAAGAANNGLMVFVKPRKEVAA